MKTANTTEHLTRKITSHLKSIFWLSICHENLGKLAYSI